MKLPVGEVGSSSLLEEGSHCGHCRHTLQSPLLSEKKTPFSSEMWLSAKLEVYE